VPTPGVLANDSDPDGDPLTIILVEDVSVGRLALDSDGGFTYRPSVRGAADSFQYAVTDGLDTSAVATVLINGPVGNTPPVADDQSVDVEVNTAVPITLTASDADGDTLTYAISTAPTHGDLTGVPPAVTYTPDVDYEGLDSFTFLANDGTEDSAPATVSINVAVPGENHPPVALDDAFALLKKVNKVDAPGVLANDSDPDGDPMTAVLVTDTVNGRLSLSPDGAFMYKPFDVGAADSFQYRVSDGKSDGNVATVTIN
jgi:hypothetical protein